MCLCYCFGLITGLLPYHVHLIIVFISCMIFSPMPTIILSVPMDSEDESWTDLKSTHTSVLSFNHLIRNTTSQTLTPKSNVMDVCLYAAHSDLFLLTQCPSFEVWVGFYHSETLRRWDLNYAASKASGILRWSLLKLHCWKFPCTNWSLYNLLVPVITTERMHKFEAILRTQHIHSKLYKKF